jgi:hypothetical protein
MVANLLAKLPPLIRAHPLPVRRLLAARRKTAPAAVVDRTATTFMAGTAVAELTAAFVHAAPLAVPAWRASWLRPGRLRKRGGDQGGKNKQAVHDEVDMTAKVRDTTDGRGTTKDRGMTKGLAAGRFAIPDIP